MANVFPRMVIRNMGLIRQKKDYRLMAAYGASVAVVYLTFPVTFLLLYLLFVTHATGFVFTWIAEHLNDWLDRSIDFFHAGADKVEKIYRQKYVETSK